MAIEFNCPYCTAPLRVPDSAMGKEGTCPKCDSALTVPVLEVPKPKQDFPMEVVTPTPRLSETAPPAAPPAPVQSDSQSDFNFLDPAPSTASTPAPPPTPTENVAESPFPGPIISEPATPSVSKNLKKKKNSNTFMTAIPVTFLAVLVGAGYWLYDNLQAKFYGTVTATQVDAEKVPTIMLGKSRIDGKENDVLEMLSALELTPANYTSKLIEVRLVGTRRALAVEVSPGEETEFFRVNLMKFPAVKKFYVDNAAKLDRPRIELLDKTMAEFKKDVLAGRPVDSKENILNYRDNLALSITVGSLGYHVEAIADGKRHRCVFQDDNNHLYFLLPAGTKEFTVVPRNVKGETSPLPESFRFEVTEVKKAKSSEPAAKSQAEMEDEAENVEGMDEGDEDSGSMKSNGQMDGESMSPGKEGKMKPGEMKPGEMQPGEMKPGMMKPEMMQPSDK